MELLAKSRLLARSDSTGCFSINHDQLILPHKGRYKLVSMYISDFLKLAKPGNDPHKTAQAEELLEDGTKFSSVPYIYFDYSHGEKDAMMTGHEGRHRGRALMKHGYTKMPVELRGPIRWSEQDDPDKFDYYGSWPDRLIGEGHAYSIPFPVSREEAAKDYHPG